ncbi:hypothetical protein HMPREF9453_01873 [Dialister succinatiphilus YIT 11850]|uniref:Uncharacterized protein n=1 Tax=Dialister succinatiphilus YIT 11850 TaxID=742743 RepID=H1D2N5_9FIRM|nr:hypothetical protein HMPREF9453_01873 [Dialister succinatiphilus YIT 11850]
MFEVSKEMLKGIYQAYSLRYTDDNNNNHCDLVDRNKKVRLEPNSIIPVFIEATS